MASGSSSGGSVSFGTLLGLLFIGLKLGGVITWSWVWVLSPIWIGAALAIILFVILLLLAL